ASPFAPIFSDFLDSRPDAYEAEPEEDFGIDEDETDDESDDDEVEMLEFDPDAEWGGDADIYADRGVAAAVLSDQVEAHRPDPAGEWGGDADISAVRGVAAAVLIDQVEAHRSDPARVVAHVGEAVGFADQLEAAR